MNEKKRPTDMERYVLEHIDEALEKGWIRVYVQPVVRTLTRKVCGVEALARWQDPEYGLLMPGDFIGVLEKHRRIHELDTYVLRRVCENYGAEDRRLDVPVSFNLSRLDYELCDIFEVVESAARMNKVPRSNLCVEITESALASNEQNMLRYIERFRGAGYAVWMDDFGSGYSSLNVLKDFVFDELKIDMRFLSDFSTRSKKILASIVHMAKLIGIQTLAEGVETEEQYAFLHSIGCDKVQGYLIGRPMPYEDCQRYVAEKGLSWEPPQLRGYYDDIGRLNVLSATPFQLNAGDGQPITGREMNSIALAILELRGDTAELMFDNKAFERTVPALDWPLAWLQTAGASALPLNRLSQRLQKLLEEARSEGEGELFSVYDEEYYEARALRLAQHGDSCAILMSVTNLSQIASLDNQQQLDDGLRSLYSLYEQVLLLNLNNSTVVSLHMGRDTDHGLSTGSLTARMEKYAARLFPDDRERFLRFLCPETMEERVTRAGSISIHLRELGFHGAYTWKNYSLVRIRKNNYYLLVRDAEGEVSEFRNAWQMPESSGQALSPELLWENAVNHSELKFFWKDRNRRFAGASRSFLKYYDFSSLADILGKTDEDMGWHIHPGPYRDEEWKVLNEGVVSRGVEGNCLVQGEDQGIVATKMPLYSRDGKIIGLLGAFFRTDAPGNEKSALTQARTDILTGLLNSRGIYEDLFGYIDEYQRRGKDFARIEVSIDDFANVNDRYGYDFGDAVIRETGKALLRSCGNTATVGRISGYTFTVFRQFEDPSEVDDLIARIRRIPSELRQIDGVPFSMYLSVGAALYSETKNRDSMATQAELRRMTDDLESISQRQLMENTSRIFHMFEELPLSYAVYKIVKGPEGADAIVLYANRRFMKKSHTTPDTLIGRRVSSFFQLASNEWLRMAEEAGSGRTVEGRFYFSVMDCTFTITAYPVIGPGFCAFTFRREETGNAQEWKPLKKS